MLLSSPLLSNIRFFFQPYHGRLAGLIVGQIFRAIVGALAIASIAPVVTSALQTASGPPGGGGALVSWVSAVGAALPFEQPMIGALVVLLVLTVTTEVTGYGTALLGNRVRAVGVRDWTLRVYEKILWADYQYFLDRRHADLTHLVTVAAYNTQTLFMMVDLIGIGLQIAAVIVLLWTVSPVGSLAVAVAAAVAYGTLSAVNVGRLRALGETQRLASRAQSRAVDEAVKGMRFVRIFETADRWREAFRNATASYTTAAIRQDALRLAPGTATSLGFVWMFTLAVWLIWRNDRSQFAAYLPVMAIFVLAVRQLVTLMSSTGDAVLGVVAALPYADTVRHALTESTVGIADGVRPFPGLERGIEFVNVSYVHKGRKRTLSHVSFTLPRNTTTGIVGVSGAGKSTIIDLLLRLYDPREGAIRVDGIDLSAIQLGSWRAAIGFISQEPFLFNGTISENINLGKVGASRDEIHEAAVIADADSFIRELPGGYDMVVSDRGLTLSGGQRQRIALARALLRRPELLLLDEATSAVDNRSEAAIRGALSRLRGRCTQVVVAHKLATVQDADQILVVDAGSIVEAGTHEQLLSIGAVYARLHRSQNQ